MQVSLTDFRQRYLLRLPVAIVAAAPPALASTTSHAGPIRVLFEPETTDDDGGGTGIVDEPQSIPLFTFGLTALGFLVRVRTRPAIRHVPFAAVLCALVLLASTPATALPLRVLFERDQDSQGGIELAINSYPTFADFYAGTNFTSQFSAINVNSPYSARGFTYDGTAYRVLFERDQDSQGGIELAINSYPTLTDFFNGTSFTSQFSVINVNAPYSVGGLAYDSDGYHVLFERDQDSQGGIELAINSYPTLADFFDGTSFTSQFSVINVNSPYSVAGFLIEPDTPGGPGDDPGGGPGTGDDPRGTPRAVSEPSDFLLFVFGLAGLVLAARLRAAQPAWIG